MVILAQLNSQGLHPVYSAVLLKTLLLLRTTCTCMILLLLSKQSELDPTKWHKHSCDMVLRK